MAVRKQIADFFKSEEMRCDSFIGQCARAPYWQRLVVLGYFTLVVGWVVFFVRSPNYFDSSPRQPTGEYVIEKNMHGTAYYITKEQEKNIVSYDSFLDTYLIIFACYTLGLTAMSRAKLWKIDISRRPREG